MGNEADSVERHGGLPRAMIPLSARRKAVNRILTLLGQPGTAEVRADLAGELTRVGAEYEDVLERAIYPGATTSRGSSYVQRGLSLVRSVRAQLVSVRHRTRHVKPVNAHLDDPEGFEHDLSELAKAFQQQLEFEDNHLFPRLQEMDPAAAEDLASMAARAQARASLHPNPPRNRLARLVLNAIERVDRKLNDTSTASHPGVQELDETQDGNRTLTGPGPAAGGDHTGAEGHNSPESR